MLELGIKHRTLVPDQNGEMHKLSDYLGKKVILYFYQKIIHQAVQNRHVVFLSVILSLLKRCYYSQE